MEYVIVALPGLIAVLVMKYLYSRDISNKEFLIHLGLAVLSGLLCLAISYGVLYSSMVDQEVLNGSVTKKIRHVEQCTQSSSCENYYVQEDCTESTDSKGNTTKSCTSYKVFDYDYEIDWLVYTSLGDKHRIKRIDAQGVKEPKRYTSTSIGDPAASSHIYLNYLLGSEDSLFYAEDVKNLDKKVLEALPDYPRIFDYYNINHVLNLTTYDTSGYEKYLSNVLKTMGAQKQVNIIVIVYDEQDNQLPTHTISKWRGGKKNDVIMFFGIDKTGNVQYFTSTSFGKGMNNELLHSKLRMNSMSEILSLQLLQHNVELVQENFNRLPNKEFKFMIYKLQPTTGTMLICSVLSLILSIAIGAFLRRVKL